MPLLQAHLGENETISMAYHIVVGFVVGFVVVVRDPASFKKAQQLSLT